MGDIKRKIVCSVDCPWCQKAIDVVKENEIYEAAVPAEKEERFRASKNDQTKLLEE